MRKPNYQFEKRRRDLEKKAKNEEKRLRKLERAANPGLASDTEPSTAEGAGAGNSDESADGVPPAAEPGATA